MPDDFIYTGCGKAAPNQSLYRASPLQLWHSARDPLLADAGFRMTSILDFFPVGYLAGSDRAAAIALIRPGIVYFFASMSTGRPSSRSVDDVTGPIEAKLTLSSGPAFRG